MAFSSPLLALQAKLSALVSVALLVIWAVTGAGALWPLWFWHELAVALALHAALRWALAGAGRMPLALGAVAAGTVVSVWLLFTGGGWWIVWPLAGLALLVPLRRLAPRGALALHAAVAGVALAIVGAVWVLGGAEGEWIAWPLLGVGSMLVAHAVCHEHLSLGRR